MSLSFHVTNTFTISVDSTERRQAKKSAGLFGESRSVSSITLRAKELVHLAMQVLGVKSCHCAAGRPSFFVEQLLINIHNTYHVNPKNTPIYTV